MSGCFIALWFLFIQYLLDEFVMSFSVPTTSFYFVGSIFRKYLGIDATVCLLYAIYITKYEIEWSFLDHPAHAGLSG